MKAKATDFRPQRHNANRHTLRGLKMLEDAMGRSGYVAPMTATADGEVIDGSARLEVAATVFDGVEPLVVDHDGTRPVIMRRTDIPSADDPRAKRIALEANRIAAVDLEWDAELLAKFAAEEPATLAGLWDDAELADILFEAGDWGGADLGPDDHDSVTLTFRLSHDQAAICESAIRIASPQDRGEALAVICGAYVG